MPWQVGLPRLWSIATTLARRRGSGLLPSAPHGTQRGWAGRDRAPWEREPADLAQRVRRAPAIPTLVFVTVPEGKTVKNRLHLDLRPVDCSHAEEVERLTSLGARRADIGQGQVPWVVLTDPEGNEFCVLGPLGD